MARFDLGTHGFAELGEELSELMEEGESDRVYEVGTNAEYGPYLERGTRHMPPYPFFRPAIVEFQVDPEGFIEGNTDYPSVGEIPSTDALVQAVAASLARQMERNVSAGSATDRSPGTHPDHPKEQTGNLKADIGFERIR